MDVREWEFQRGYVEVNLDYIVENLQNMKDNIDAETKILAVIKTDGYGHGGVAIAKAVENLDYLYGFAVATAEEAARTAGIDLTDEAFWRSALDMVAAEIDLFCELVQNK